MKEVILLDKPVSVTPLQAIERFKERNTKYQDKKMSYAGRLDPMAEGLLVCLVGEENKKQQEYQKLDKEYEFEVLFGVSTDTYDVMGLLNSLNISQYPDNMDEQAEKHLKEFRGEIIQQLPPYSSYRIKGKPLFWWAREGRLDEIEIPKKQVEVKELNPIDSYQMEIGQIIEEVVNRVSAVEGEFRQKQIISRWKRLAKENAKEKLRIFKFSCSVTSGTYIRSIADKLGEKLGTGAVAFSILRTRVGEYNLEDAQTLKKRNRTGGGT
ncbi:MAG: hypothetical protein ABEJ02_03105 [Candidatus Paceibacteria bacterium]